MRAQELEKDKKAKQRQSASHNFRRTGAFVVLTRTTTMQEEATQAQAQSSAQEAFILKAEAAQSAHVKAWWYGKALQVIDPATERDLHNKLYSSNVYLKYNNEKELFLSPGAAEMVVYDENEVLREIESPESWKVENFIDLETGSLRWERFTLAHILRLYAPTSATEGELAGNIEGEGEKKEPAVETALLGTRKEFYLAAKYLQKVSWVVHRWLLSLGLDNFERLYKDKYSILFRQEVSLCRPRATHLQLLL